MAATACEVVGKALIFFSFFFFFFFLFYITENDCKMPRSVEEEDNIRCEKFLFYNL